MVKRLRMADGPARLLRLLQACERWLAISAFLILIVVIFADVLNRELTGSGLYWASQIGVWANILVVMAGFGLASADGAHLRPRITDAWLPDSWQPALHTLQHSCMALFCICIALLAARVVGESWRLGEVSIDLFWPIWPIQMFLPLAFGVAALRHSLYVLYPSLRPAEQSALALERAEDQT